MGGKHKHDKKQGHDIGKVQEQVKGFLHKLGEELQDWRGDVTGAFDKLARDVQDASLIDDVEHQAKGVFIRVERSLHDAVHGAGPVEQVLRKFQDCVREAQHTCRVVAKKIDHDMGRHLGKNTQHKMQEIWHRVQDFFSKLVEKVGHFIKDVKQHGMSSVLGGRKKTHDKQHHHDIPHPDPLHQRPKPKPWHQ